MTDIHRESRWQAAHAIADRQRGGAVVVLGCQRGGGTADREPQVVEDAPAQRVGGAPGSAVFAGVGGLGDVGHQRSVAGNDVSAVNGRPTH